MAGEYAPIGRIYTGWPILTQNRHNLVDLKNGRDEHAEEKWTFVEMVCVHDIVINTIFIAIVIINLG